MIINTSRIDSAYQSGSINQTLDDTDIDEFLKKFIIEAKQKADSPLTKHLHFTELQKLMVKESLSVSLISEVQEIVKKPIDDSYVTFQEDLTGHIKKYVYGLDLTSTNPEKSIGLMEKFIRMLPDDEKKCDKLKGTIFTIKHDQ